MVVCFRSIALVTRNQLRARRVSEEPKSWLSRKTDRFWSAPCPQNVWNFPKILGGYVRSSEFGRECFPIFHYPHHVVTDVPPCMRPTDRLAHQPTLPHLPPHLKGAPPQEAGLTRNLGRKRGRECFHVRFGRSREFLVDQSPSCFAILITQSSRPKGRPRCALERRSAN